MFRGLGPSVVAASGGLALLTALAQWMWPLALSPNPTVFFLCWVFTALISAGLIGVEMIARSRRHHGGLADAMVISAIERFIPSALAGAAIAAVMMKYSPTTLWILPGLWQVLVALGLFSAIRSLPRAINFVAAWYFVAGIVVLIMSSFDQALSPWYMGVPFTVGQLALGLCLHIASGEFDGEE